MASANPFTQSAFSGKTRFLLAAAIKLSLTLRFENERTDEFSQVLTSLGTEIRVSGPCQEFLFLAIFYGQNPREARRSDSEKKGRNRAKRESAIQIGIASLITDHLDS